MSNESMANSITDVPSAIAELLAVNKQLEQQLSKAQADLELAVEALEFCSIENLFTSNGEYNELFKYNYKEWFQDVVNQALKQIKETNEKENCN